MVPENTQAEQAQPSPVSIILDRTIRSTFALCSSYISNKQKHGFKIIFYYNQFSTSDGLYAQFQVIRLHAKISISTSQRYPLKLCLIKYDLFINVYNFENWLFSIWGFSTKVTCAFLLQENMSELSKIKTCKLRKSQYLPNDGSKKVFNGTIVNQTFSYFQGGSLEFTNTVPFR